MIASLAGCPGPQGPATYPVSGTVTLDEEPLAEGQIVFEPLSADGTRPSSGPVVQGKFSFTIEEGMKRVRITAEREVGEADPVMGARRRENYIPLRYNERSELTAEVTADAEGNVFNFPLKSK